MRARARCRHQPRRRGAAHAAAGCRRSSTRPQLLRAAIAAQRMARGRLTRRYVAAYLWLRSEANVRKAFTRLALRHAARLLPPTPALTLCSRAAPLAMRQSL